MTTGRKKNANQQQQQQQQMAHLLLGDVFLAERQKLQFWTSCLGEALRYDRSSCLPYVLSRDGFPFRIFFVAFASMFILLLFIRRIVAKPVSQLCLGMFRGPHSAAALAKQNKFISSFVEFTLYTGFGVFGTLLLKQQSWIWHPETWSKGWWQSTPASSVSAHVLVFALLYSARYLAMLVSLVVLEPRKKDFGEMVVHHIVTVGLVCTSVAFGYIRIGLVIMVVFDYADPFLHLAKMLNYCKQTHRTWRTLAVLTDAMLAAFALVFFVTRILLFSYIVYSVSVESYIVVGGADDLFMGLNRVEVGHHVSVALIWILYALQWFWFSLLLKVIYRTVVLGDEAGDNRSSGEEEEQAAVKSNKKTQ